MISGPTPSGQPGKAVGHAVEKLTLRHDLDSEDPVIIHALPLRAKFYRFLG
jgi:hypothetical protein